MLVLPCFPAIARRGFAKLARLNLAKPTRFYTPTFPQTPRFSGQNKKGGNAKAQAFATKKRVCAGVAKVQNPTTPTLAVAATPPTLTGR